MIKHIVLIFDELILSFLLILPGMHGFNRLRAKYYNIRRNICIENDVQIGPNVRLTGKITIKNNTLIAQNCSFSGAKAGIVIGENVMIAANCCFVAFDHSYSRKQPMIFQSLNEALIKIEDNCWIASNVTITKGVIIREGTIVAANAVVTKDTDSYTIVGGVPAKILKEINDDTII